MNKKPKPRKCKNPECEEVFTPFYNTTQAVCSPKCAIAYAKICQDKKEANQWCKEKKKMKINTTNWKNNLQKEVQKIARHIDYGLLCLARNKPGQIHGGHIFSKGGHSNMRFDLHNIHRQSAQSNKWFSDDSLLREKLQQEYGSDYFEMLKEMRNREQVKYSNEDYHSFYIKARKISNLLSKKNKDLVGPRTVNDRMRLREEINKEIGIYKDDTELNNYKSE